ncbi:MAG: AraC-like DNA-binding protein [Candidatus Promineifilaceae bacterium]|jgi:AraC-like DNA-binding protein
MSIYDTRPISIEFAATSRSPKAPQAMRHPTHGAFQLTHVNLSELHDGPTRSREHRHDVYHLVIFEQAKNQMRLNRGLVNTHRGLCMMTHPDDSHCFPPKQHGRTVYHAFTFRFADMTAPPPLHSVLTHYTGIALPDAPNAFTLPETAMLRLPGMLAAIHSALVPNAGQGATHLYHALLGLFCFVAEQRRAQAGVQSSKQRPPAVFARNEIDAHYTDRVSIADLAQHAGVTAAHLGRAFQNRYGISPGRYREQLRMEAAVNLLRHSDLLIKTIAYELGYPDASTFSKAFQRHAGISPKSCRQSGARHDPFKA